MPSARASPSTLPSELLHYLPDHRVLICKECQYAIQPSAVSRHLKDLHHIYRSNRQRLVEYAKELQLADPADVVLPPPGEAPVPFLPAESGLACAADGCTHLCVTVKRMKSHWATAHKENVIGSWSGSPRWHPVTLQTFFRGNQLRYFVVSGVSTLEPTPDADGDLPGLISEISLPSDWNAEDMTLFTHFRQSTCQDFGRTEASKRLWQTPIPDMAYSHDFLKYGILACSALHLAYLHHGDRKRYQMLAACHQARALPLFRTALSNVSEDNCNAILASSQLLLIHCFASDEQNDDLLLVRGKYESGLPDWLEVIRCSCTVFSVVWSYMSSGLLSSLIEEGEQETAMPHVPEKPEHAARFKELLAMPVFRDTSSIEGEIDDKTSAYGGALLALSRGFMMAESAKQNGMFTMWTAVSIWPTRISLEFLELLRAREPAALVLLAHYCVLLEPLEKTWYMSGFRKRLLERIYRQLHVDWRQWLEWPFAEARLKLPDMMCDV